MAVIVVWEATVEGLTHKRTVTTHTLTVAKIVCSHFSMHWPSHWLRQWERQPISVELVKL